ncbi:MULTISPECIES: hypothetical protein [unclassified Pseudomonas]|uniref:hypothetical protein n=1 Tax=unclassified Pseudomonas TaxID=196821 RepID=UPI002446F36A|nr:MULTISPECIES: hypothetical protein [unclassified Pseudomonas]MDG9923685.1 hypothetical protein [Pseudomonas sp. GD04045]MDH0036447.1 hypothetical protein [Pseudomonas sp. GD04019]
MHSADPNPDEPLSRLLFKLVWELFKLVAPIAALTVLHPLLALGLVLLAALFTWGAVRLAWRRPARLCNGLVTAGAIGFGFSIIHWAPTWWGITAGIVLLFVGLGLASTLERRLGLAKAKPEATEAAAVRGASAWGGDDLLTPEGEVVRTFAWGEIAMGGPTYGNYLFPDGVLLEGIGASARFSSSGRYFAAPLPSRDTWGLLILDRQERRVYRSAEVGEFWEIDEFSDEAISGRHSPLVGNQGYRMALADLLRQSEMVELVAVADLWLEPGWSLPHVDKDFPAPAGDHRLRGIAHLPERLRELDDPLAPLRYPTLRLEIDGEPSDLLIAAEAVPVWRADGQALVCHAAALQSTPHWSRPLWLWQAGQGWRQLPEPWAAADDEPGLSWEGPRELTEQTLTLAGRMNTPQLDHLRFGYELHDYYSDVETCIGHDAEGRLLAGEQCGTGLVRVLPLMGEGRRGEGAVLGEPLLGGDRPRFEWLRDSSDGRLGAYACRIGDWVLEDQWLLDHRVSDCGRYLALVAFAEAPAVPHRVCVVDMQRRRLLEFAGQPLVARLLDFRAGVLSLAQVRGRLARDEGDTPLRRFDRAAPAALRAARFIEREEDSRLYYQRLELRVGQEALEALPNWRLVECPQVANADGDFVLPAPGGGDAAWLFGAQSEYRDHYLRERHPRGGGCLLTASGLAVADLGPSLIWSADGRYLALTRHIPRMQVAERVNTDQWQLLLLDTRERNLRSTGSHIGCMPQFLRFADGVIEWRVLPSDWEHEDAATEWQVRSLPLSNLLPPCGTQLQARGALWLPPAELVRAGQWQALDAVALQAWRNIE